jgi:cytoskeleton protein RodZ
LADIGSTLRTARTARGLSIEQVAQDTRISARFLEALESERFDSLPAPVYVRGFLRSYATYLRLDPAPLLEELNGIATPTPPSTGSAERISSSPDALSSRRPASAQRAAGERSDPFQRPAALPRNETPAAPQYQQSSEFEPEFEPEYEPYEPQPEPLGAGAVLREAGAFAPDADSYRRRRTQGVLAERPDDGDGTGGSRLLLMAAGGILVLLSALAAAVFLTQGNGDDGSAPAAPPSSPTAANRTVVPIGSATAAPSANGATAAASPSTTATVEPNAAPTPTTEALPTPQATSTPVPGTAPTQGPANTPTPETTPSPTATTPPPTATPIPPTPFATATPIIAHPFEFGECAGGDCGPAPLRVICVPDGSWFVDVGHNWGPLPPGWREVSVSRASQALNACG